MSLRTLEAEILKELRIVTKRPKLKAKDMLEWSTSEAVVRKNAQEGEEVFECPEAGVWCAVPAVADKK